MNKIKLGPKDAALIFREEGEDEIHLPNQNPSEEALQSSFNLIRCVAMLNNPAILAMVDKEIEEKLRKGDLQ